MNAHEKTIELAGGVWDSLKTSQRIALLFLLGAAVSGAFWLGVRSGGQTGESKLAAMEAKYEREITELKRKQSEAAPIGLTIEPEVIKVLPGHSEQEEKPVPEVTSEPPAKSELVVSAPAKPEPEKSDTTIVEFVRRSETLRGRNPNETETRLNSFIVGSSEGKLHTWKGYVEQIYSNGPYIVLTLQADLANRQSFAPQCVFDERPDMNIINGLRKDQEIMVSGVMNSRGELRDTKIIWFEPIR